MIDTTGAYHLAVPIITTRKDVMSKTKTPAAQEAVTHRGVTLHIEPKANGYICHVIKDGQKIFELTEPTLYLSAAGQLRRFLDLGLSL